jgi:hypothetical protein
MCVTEDDITLPEDPYTPLSLNRPDPWRSSGLVRRVAIALACRYGANVCDEGGFVGYQVCQIACQKLAGVACWWIRHNPQYRLHVADVLRLVC